MHIKRSEMPKSWPVPRKGSAYIAAPSHAIKKGISVLFILRDILKIANTKKEVRFMALNGDIKVNNKIRKDENFPVQVLDVLTLEKAKKSYRMQIVNKKFKLVEVKGDIDSKIVKISGKKILTGKKVQMNLEDGQNILSKESFSAGDSVILNTKTGKIEKVLPLRENAKVEIVSGKHAGEKGVVKGIVKLVRGKEYLIKLDKKEVTLPGKTILIIG